MRRIFISGALASSLLFTSCLGSFSAFNNLKDWNQSVTSNKFVNNLLFWAMNIVPVYGLFYFGDVVIFNVIEFWSGSNPIAMKPGEIETQIVKKDGRTFLLTATQNQLKIEVIEGENEGNHVSLDYNTEEQAWYATQADGETVKLASYEEGFYLVYLPNGEEVKIDATASKEEGLALINQTMINYNEGMLVAK